MRPRVVIAEDEAVLRAELAAELAQVWPEAQLVGQVGDGDAALEAFETLGPEVMFLDVRMPGLTGIEVAKAVAGQCHVVFITAHADAAVAAFEAGAIDYVLKPVVRARLAQTIERLKARWSSLPDLETQRASLSLVEPEAPKLRWLQASAGRSIEFVAIDEVAFFKAEDKYTTVATRDGRDLLIRMSLKELLPQLEAERFWQVHRAAIVNVSHVERVARDELGELEIRIKGRAEVLQVSRAFKNRFRHL